MEVPTSYLGQRVKCGQCKGTFVAEDAGETAPVQKPATAPPILVAPNRNFNCPHCGSADLFQNVSVLYDSQTTRISTKTAGSGIGISTAGIGIGVGSSKTQGLHQSILAEKLAPPKYPTRSLSNTSLVAGIGMLLLGIGMISDSSAGPVWAGSLFVALGLTCLALYPKAKKMDHKASAEYALAYKQWQSLWFCQKCGNFTQK